MELRANGKYIETTPIERIFTQGEAYADKLIFIVDAVNNGVDVSGCTFVMRTVAIDGSMTETVLEKSVQDELIILTWHVPDTVTAVAGMLQLEIIGSQDAQLIIKYKMRAVFVKEAIFGENIPVPDVLEEKLAQMNELIEEARNLVTLDATLTIEGAPADAKAVGDAISVVQAAVNVCSEAIEELKNSGGSDQEVVDARYSPVSGNTFATLSQRLNADISSRASQTAFEHTMSDVYTRLNALEEAVANGTGTSQAAISVLSETNGVTQISTGDVLESEIGNISSFDTT